MGNNYQILIEKLDAFIRKYYKNRLLKGVIYSLGLLLASFIIITTLEYFVQFSITGRTVLFYLFLASACYLLINFVAIPLSKLYKFGKVINHDQAAEIIGNHFEEVNDKLINVLQLEHKALKDSNELLLASIDQKSLELKPVPFSRAIDFSENKQHLKYLIIPLVLIIGIAIVSPKIFTVGTERLVNHNNYIEPVAPFKMELLNSQLSVLKNKDFTLELTVSGAQLPDKIYIEFSGNKYPISKQRKSTYTYTFNGIVYNNQPINGGQSVTICAEVGSAFGSSEDVTVFEGNTTCTSDASCAADDVCREYDIFNSSIIEQGSYKYRDCSGVNRIEVILPGQTDTICSQTPPRVATSDQAFVFVTALGFCS